MSGAFSRPPGEPGSLMAASHALGQLDADLSGAGSATTAAVATALSLWTGPRRDSFQHAGAGLQAEIASAAQAAAQVADAVGRWATALRAAQDDIADLAAQADAAQQHAEDATGHLSPDSTDVDVARQHADARVGQLVRQAEDVRRDLQRTAGDVAAIIDSAANLAVTGATTLAPDDIRRRVDTAYGVTGLHRSAVTGR